MKILILTDYERYGGVATASAAVKECFFGLDVEVERYPIHAIHRGMFGRLYSILKAALYLRSHTADKVILMHFEAILVGLLCRSLKPNSVFINSVHTDLHGYYYNASSLKKFVLRYAFKVLKNDTVVFDSKESELKAKINFGFTNTNVIYNAVHLSQKVVPMNDKKTFKFGSVSRLHAGKNVDLLIRIFNSFWLTHNGVELIIFGDGPELIKLKSYTKKFPCYSAVNFKGYSNKSNEIYNQIDCLVGFSSMEGFGLVILEALIRNIPVLHSDCSCGPREILKPTSDPRIKTASYEMGEGGMLVKIPEKIIPYAPSLNDSEKVILEAFNIFYQEVENIKKSSFVDFKIFGPDVIRRKWAKLIFSTK